MSALPASPPASACAYYIARDGQDQSKPGPYFLDLDEEIPDWLTPDTGTALFDGFFPAGPYAMQGTWGEDYPVAYVATFKSTSLFPVPAAISARRAWQGWLFPRVFWDDDRCEPSQAYWDWARLTGAPAELNRTMERNYYAGGGALGRVADAIQENVPTPAEVGRAAKRFIMGASEVVGEGAGILAATFTEAAARGTGKGIVAFWDELPMAGKAAAGLAALVLVAAAVKRIT